MAGVVVQIVGGLAVLVPCIIICRAYTKRTEAMAELIEALDRWQTGYLPVFAVWAATVVAVLPPVFAFR